MKETLTSYDTIIVFVILYFIPTIASVFAPNKKTSRMFALNLMWGWTIFGWWYILLIVLRNEKTNQG